MELNIALTGTDCVAWWGAIVATGVLIWDVYKWKSSGARLRLKVQAGMKMLGDPAREQETWVTVRVTNVGNQPTTITTVGLRHYASWWDYVRRKPAKSFIIPQPSLSHQTLPHVLDVGQEWLGGAVQTCDIETMAEDGRLVIEVYDAVHNRPVIGRVVVGSGSRGLPLSRE